MRNGAVLYESNADRRQHPASLTKMMTLYLTFEAVRDGRLGLDQKLRVSQNAARQPASKLYLKAGQRVAVRDLIRAAAIKSANDAAMVLAEGVGGSERAFAEMMTRRARQLGMKNSSFRNPHGLTASGHMTTARDMATLARHLYFDFPEYFNIFGRTSDYAAGKRIWTTNRLLKSYPGADGLKTGYTRAAGYNLAATAHRGDKRVVAVLLGGRSSAQRNQEVARLLDLGFGRAQDAVRSVRPQGPGRLLVSAAPLPEAKPEAPATGLAAVAEALSPAAEAATPPAAVVAPVTVMSRSRLAPRAAGLPPRRISPAVTTLQLIRGQDGIPVPLPRPGSVVAWAAQVGPLHLRDGGAGQPRRHRGQPRGGRRRRLVHGTAEQRKGRRPGLQPAPGGTDRGKRRATLRCALGKQHALRRGPCRPPLSRPARQPGIGGAGGITADRSRHSGSRRRGHPREHRRCAGRP